MSHPIFLTDRRQQKLLYAQKLQGELLMPYRTYLKQMTFDVLGRIPAEGSLTDRADQLLAGETFDTAAFRLLNSKENREKTNRSSTRAFFGKSAH